MGEPKDAAGTNTELYSKSKLVKIEGPNENVYTNLENSQSLDDLKLQNLNFPIKEQHVNSNIYQQYNNKPESYKPESNQ